MESSVIRLDLLDLVFATGLMAMATRSAVGIAIVSAWETLGLECNKRDRGCS